MFIRDPLVKRSDRADQFYEHIVTSFQHHQ